MSNLSHQRPAEPEDIAKTIERIEEETGQRVSMPGVAAAGLVGAMSRMLGKSNHRPEDDVAAGTVMAPRLATSREAEPPAQGPAARLKRRNEE